MKKKLKEKNIDVNVDARNIMDMKLISKIILYHISNKIVITHVYCKTKLCADVIARNVMCHLNDKGNFDNCPSFITHLFESGLIRFATIG